MTGSGQEHAFDGPNLVALSQLRLGFDTRGARLFREAIGRGLFAGVLTRTQALERLADLIGIRGPERAEAVSRATERADRAIQTAGAAGLSLLTLADERYPALLRAIPDPPIVLWTRGDVSVLKDIAVAVVGSRRASPGGLEVARRLGSDIARAGIVVVSGLARGIDAAAHRGALQCEGRTVAVLGNGADVVYPPEHERLTAEIATRGVIVTEYPPGTRPYASHFPLRNRIISGLSRAIVIVEASEKSGSLITAKAALEQGRDVLAVPGNVTSGHHRGCHALIKDGARLVETVDDLLEELGRPRQQGVDATAAGKRNVRSELAGNMIAGQSVSLDELAVRTGRPASHLLAELAELEIAGIVARTSGGAFIRLDASGTNRGR